MQRSKSSNSYQIKTSRVEQEKYLTPLITSHHRLSFKEVKLVYMGMGGGMPLTTCLKITESL